MSKFIVEGIVTKVTDEFIILNDTYKINCHKKSFLIGDKLKCVVNRFDNMIGIPQCAIGDDVEYYVSICSKGEYYVIKALNKALGFHYSRFKNIKEMTRILLAINTANTKYLEGFMKEWEHNVFWRLFEILDIPKENIEHHLEDNIINYDLYDELVKNPIKYYAISIDKVEEIAKVYNIKYGKLDYLCGNIVRFIWQQRLKNNSTCVSIDQIKLNYLLGFDEQSTNKILDILKKEFDLVEVESHMLLGKFYRAKKFIMDTFRENYDNVLKLTDDEDVNIDALDEIQNKAINTILNNKYTLVTGAAGTGKTFLIKHLVEYLTSKGLDVFITAFTGKAVFRVKELLPYHSSIFTIHKAFMSYKSILFSSHFVIIDEISMVSSYLFSRLLNYMNPDTHIVFVGDNNQLAPVEAGSIMNNIMKLENLVTRIHLEKIYRSDDAIIKFSNDIKSCNYNIEFDGINVVKYDDDMLHVLYEEVSKVEGTYQILCPYNSDVNNINEYFQSKVNSVEYIDKRGRVWKLGESCILTCNIYIKGNTLYNGYIGIITDINKYKRGITVKFDEIEVFFEDTRYGITKLQLAYAITIHKSQGSEWDNIFLYLNSSRPNTQFLSRELMYTACTRAKKNLYIVDDISKVYHSLANKQKENFDILYKL